MQRNIVKFEPDIPAALQAGESISMLSVIAEAARDPQVDAAKMRELWELVKSIRAQDAEVAFNRDMVAAQAAMQPVVRDAVNDQTNSRYAKLEQIDRAIRPIYTQHGFSLTFNSRPSDTGMLCISCQVLHVAGHTKQYEISGALDISGIKGNTNKTAMHATGSSVSYLRRYLECLIFHIILTDEDNDGNGVLTESVGAEVLDRIRAGISACGMDAASEGAFCRFMGVSRIEEIRACDAGKALTALRAKYRSAHAREGAN